MDFDSILINEKSYKNILVYDISYKILIGEKLLRIKFGKVNGFFRVYDGNKLLVLFEPEKYDAAYNKIRNFISQKSGACSLVVGNGV